MSGEIDEAEKAARLAALQSLIDAQQLDFNRTFLGRTVLVLFDRSGRKSGQLAGRSPHMQAVHAEAAERHFGAIAEVVIERAAVNSLAGCIAEATVADAEGAAA